MGAGQPDMLVWSCCKKEEPSELEAESSLGPALCSVLWVILPASLSTSLYQACCRGLSLSGCSVSTHPLALPLDKGPLKGDYGKVASALNF